MGSVEENSSGRGARQDGRGGAREGGRVGGRKKRPIIRVRNVHKIYKMGTEVVRALDGVTLDIQRNEFVAVMGSSGSGKSTLMNLLGCLDRASKGVYELNGKRTDKMGAGELARIRNEEIGFVFQSFELLPRETALKNVQLALLYSRQRFWGSRGAARRALQHVGLGDRVGHRPNQMSGGQRQRVAIARALVNRPSILLADEPTGNLDSTTGAEIMGLFHELHEDGQTIVMVTHEEDIAGHADRIVRLCDGKVETDYPRDEDPIHIDYIKRSVDMARERAAAHVEHDDAVEAEEAAR